MKWILVSTVFHLLLFWVVLLKLKPQKSVKEFRPSRLIAVSIVKKQEKPEKAIEKTKPKTSLAKKLSKQPSDSKKSSKDVLKTQGDALSPDEKGEGKTSKVSSYGSLLPGGSLAFSKQPSQGDGQSEGENEYGSLTTNSKINVDSLIAGFEIPFSLKIQSPKRLYAKAEIQYSAEEPHWKIMYLNGSNGLLKALLYEFLYEKKNLERLKPILRELNRSSIVVQFNYEYDPHAFYNGDHQNIELKNAVLSMNFKRSGGKRTTGNLPDSHVEKREARDRIRIRKLTRSKAFSMRIQNEIIRLKG